MWVYDGILDEVKGKHFELMRMNILVEIIAKELILQIIQVIQVT